MALANRKSAESGSRALAKSRKDIETIMRSRSFSGKEKRQNIDDLIRRRNQRAKDTLAGFEIRRKRVEEGR